MDTNFVYEKDCHFLVDDAIISKLLTFLEPLYLNNGVFKND